jgi:hypothetical protein
MMDKAFKNKKQRYNPAGVAVLETDGNSSSSA